MSSKQNNDQTEVATKEEIKTKEPSMYKVILLNDDYTSMEFVVQILESVFHKTAEEAKGIMLLVHEKGSGVAGIYTKDIAETKIAIVQQLARQKEYPLKCRMEQV